MLISKIIDICKRARQLSNEEFLQKIDDFEDFINQPERLNPEDSCFVEFGCSMPIRFNTSEGIKRMEPGKSYDGKLNEIRVCDSLNTANK